MQRRGGRLSRATVVQMLVVGLVASAIGIAIGLAIDWFPTAASKQAGPIDRLWDVLVICSVPIFVGVCVVVLFSVRLFRQRPGEELLDGPPIHGNTKLEVVWTTLPALMLVSLCTYAYLVLRDVEQAPAASAAPELKVDVYGQQFAWTFKYPIAGGKEVATTQLYLPKGRSVKFAVRSKDVIHDFWVPNFRMKVDAVPGVTTGYRITPTRLGDYPVVCAELCGLGHAYMRQTVHVLEPAKFDAWLAKETTEAGAPSGGAAAGSGATGDAGAAPAGETASADGKTIFTKGNDNGALSCGTCHQLADAGTPQGVGPNLGEVLKGMSPDEIRTDVVDPGAEVTKGFPPNVMPGNYKDVLSPAELDAVVSYLVAQSK
jgi:cytochrome c oxidase subunit 2